MLPVKRFYSSPEFLQIEPIFAVKQETQLYTTKYSLLCQLFCHLWKLLYKAFLLLEKLEVTACSVYVRNTFIVAIDWLIYM